MSDAEATLIVAAGTAMYGLDVMGGIIAGEGVAVIGPGPIGLMGVAGAEGLRPQPAIPKGPRPGPPPLGARLPAHADAHPQPQNPHAAGHGLHPRPRAEQGP